MPLYQIENQISAIILGVYEAENEAAALEAMAIDSGAKSYAEVCEIAPAQKNEIIVTLLDSKNAGGGAGE
jgi:hypothetical protein